MGAGKSSTSRPELTLNIWRYYGQKNFESAYHLNLAFNTDSQNYRVQHMGYAGQFHDYIPVGYESIRQYRESFRRLVNPLRDELSAQGQGNTIYERLQNYSLGLMNDIDYINSAEAQDIIKSSFELHPDQVTIIEATEEKRESELVAQYGKIPESARRSSDANAWADYQDSFDMSLLWEGPGEYVPPKRDPIYEIKTALSWIVAGQNVKQNFALPLESGLVIPIDRKKHKHIWEVGRAGQTKISSFEETLRASAYMALMELTINGGDINSAYVFAHSLSPLHTRLYKSKFGMTEYSKYQNSEKETCLIAPLTQFLKLYPISLFSEAIAQLKRKDSFQRLLKYRQSLNMSLQGEHGGVDIRDFSYLTSSILGYSLAEEPVYSGRDSIGDYAGANHNLQSYPVFGVREDDHMTSSREGFLRLRPFLERNNAVEVTVKDGYSHAPAMAIAEAYLFMKNRAKNTSLENVRFCFTAYNGKGEQLRSLGPLKHWFIRRNRYISYMNLGGGRRIEQTAAEAIDIQSYCFSSEQIEGWLTSGEGPTKPLNISPSNKDQFLTNPQLFEP